MNAYKCIKCGRTSYSAANGALAPTRCAYEGCDGRIKPEVKASAEKKHEA